MSAVTGEHQEAIVAVGEQGFDPGRRRLLRNIAIGTGIVATPPLLYAGYRALEGLFADQSTETGKPAVDTLVLGLPSNYIETQAAASPELRTTINTLMGTADWQIKGDDPPSPNRLHARMEDPYGQRLSVSVAVPARRWNDLKPQLAPSGWMFNTADGQFFNLGTVITNNKIAVPAPIGTVYEKETPGPRGSGRYVLEGYTNPGTSNELYFSVVGENLNAIRRNEEIPGVNGRSMLSVVAQLASAGALGPVAAQ